MPFRIKSLQFQLLDISQKLDHTRHWWHNLRKSYYRNLKKMFGISVHLLEIHFSVDWLRSDFQKVLYFVSPLLFLVSVLLHQIFSPCYPFSLTCHCLNPFLPSTCAISYILNPMKLYSLSYLFSISQSILKLESCFTRFLHKKMQYFKK